MPESAARRDRIENVSWSLIAEQAAVTAPDVGRPCDLCRLRTPCHCAEVTKAESAAWRDLIEGVAWKLVAGRAAVTAQDGVTPSECRQRHTLRHVTEVANA